MVVCARPRTLRSHLPQEYPIRSPRFEARLQQGDENMDAGECVLGAAPSEWQLVSDLDELIFGKDSPEGG